MASRHLRTSSRCCSAPTCAGLQCATRASAAAGAAGQSGVICTLGHILDDGWQQVRPPAKQLIHLLLEVTEVINVLLHHHCVKARQRCARPGWLRLNRGPRASVVPDLEVPSQHCHALSSHAIALHVCRITEQTPLWRGARCPHRTRVLTQSRARVCVGLHVHTGEEQQQTTRPSCQLERRLS